MSEPGIVIVGAGECGMSLAVALIEAGHSGPIHLVGEETGHPYERPPLSKAHLEPGETPATLALIGAQLLETNRHVIHHQGVTATAIDRAAHELALSNGTRLAYGKLVLTTGATPRRLPLAMGLTGIHYLRAHGDATALRQALVQGGPVAIIGAGFIGLEVAAAARAHGNPVTIIEAQPRILARGADAEISAAVQALHEDHGVSFLLSTSLAGLRNEDAEVLISLADGREIRASTVVIGIGAVPNVGLAEEAGLTVENGVVVDERLTTSDPDIFAAGDCCAFALPVYDGRRVRLESWRNARDQAVQLAAVLTGGEVPRVPVPWFWSDQYDHGLQVAGLVDEGVSQVRRSLPGGGFLTFHSDAGGRLIAACGFGPGQSVARDIRLAEMLIAARAAPDPAALADPTVKLKSLLS